MANSICVLHPWEVEELQNNRVVPTCRNHKHIKRIEAMELTARGDNVHDAKAAKWVGPGMICMTVQAVWAPRQSGYAGPLVLQMRA